MEINNLREEHGGGGRPAAPVHSMLLTSVRRRHHVAVQKLKTTMGKRIRRDELPYTWSIGYNNCVGRYSPGGKYSRFGGSSLNRNPQLKTEGDGEKLSAATEHLLAMARKVRARMGAYGGKVPQPLIDLLLFGDSESEKRLVLWISEQVGRDVQPMGYGIHVLSPRSRGKIKDKATAFFRASPGSRVFATLTFIAPVADHAGVAILNKFLTAARKEFKNLQFLWVAERQDNGNIHFHIIMNKRLPVRRWNAMWVLQQYNAGLVGRSKYDQLITIEEIRERYRRGTIQQVLNPFDVKRVRSIDGLSQYLTKYITKQEKGKPFGCAVWHCSRRVSRMFTRATVGPSAFSYMRSFANWKVDKKTGECFAPEVIKGAFHVMIYVHNKAAPLRFMKELEQINKWILAGHDVDRLWLIDDDLYRQRFCHLKDAEGGP